MSTRKDPNHSEARIAVMANNVEYIKKDIDEIKERLSNNFVVKEEFEPVKKIVYGLVSLVLIAVVGAIVALVVN